MSNKQDLRQSIIRSYQKMIADQASFTTNGHTEGDNLIDGINTQITPPFLMSPNEPPTLAMTILANKVANGQTGARHATPAINKLFPTFTSGTITLPALSGNTIIVSPTIQPAPTLTLSPGDFMLGLIECDGLGNLSISLGTAGASEVLAGFPKANSKRFQIGVVVITNTGGNIDTISHSKLIQFAGGGGSGGGSTEVDMVLGENLVIGDAVYISEGAADGGRTAGRVYKLDNTNEYRKGFIGLVIENGSTGETKTVKLSGVMEDLVGLTVGLPVYWTTTLTQTEPAVFNTWKIQIGLAISATEMIINPAIFDNASLILEGTQTIANNQVASANITDLLMNFAGKKRFDIEYIAERTATIPAVDPGLLDTSFVTNAADGSKLNAQVFAITTQTDGKVLIGGNFTSYAGTANRNRLVRLNSDGTVDSAFCINASDSNAFDNGVLDIKIQADNKILVGGNFINYAGTANRNRLVRLNSDGTLDTTFCTNAVDGTQFQNSVYSIEVQSDNKILVGGDFQDYNGTVGRNRLIRLNSDGTLDTTFCNNASDGSKIGAVVNKIKMHSTSILVGGSFDAYAGTAGRSKLIQLNSDGTTDTTFCSNSSDGSKFNGSILTIDVQSDSKVLVGGVFTAYAGTAGRSYLIRLNSDGTTDIGFCGSASDSSKFNNAIYSVLELSDGKIVVGGYFTAYSGFAGLDRLTVLNGTGTFSTNFALNVSFSSKFNNGVLSLATDNDDSLFVGGIFTVYGGTAGRLYFVKFLNGIAAIQEEYSEAGDLRGMYFAQGLTWQMDNDAVGNADVDFTITAGGQIQYTSSNMSATGYVGNIKYKIKSLL